MLGTKEIFTNSVLKYSKKHFLKESIKFEKKTHNYLPGEIKNKVNKGRFLTEPEWFDLGERKTKSNNCTSSTTSATLKNEIYRDPILVLIILEYSLISFIVSVII